MDSDVVVKQYKALSESGLREVLLVEYRCYKGCLLLHVWQSPAGVLYYRPAVRISKKMQSRTGTAHVGKVAGTAGNLDDLSEARWVWGDDKNSILMGCWHCIGLRLPAATIKADAAAATPGNPVKVADFRN